jgi:geranylgeranyl pyrophosphate synthase
VGDCLVGLGYQLIGSVAADLGAACAADILAAVSSAHVRLCSGQGLELAWANDPAASPAPIAMLQAYALKTAPAFEAAFHMGMRAAGPGPNLPRLRLYCRHLGVAYQARNDLKDWEEDALDKMVAGQDALAARPTILRALAMDAADAKARAELDRIASAGEAQSSALTRACEIYRSLGVFERTETLIEKCRQRALAEADGIEPLALRDLLRFVVDAML